MKPVLILHHLHGDGPAYLGTWLRREGVAHVVRNTEAGEDFPASMGAYAALAVLGGAMSANDPLPSLRRAEALILDAMARDRPVLGHCLGGQLMARALGARVAASPAPEIGWQPMSVAREAQHRHGSVQSGEAMRAGAPEKLPLQQALADRIYRRWLTYARAGR